ncbi:hypothetical protein L596_011123 [Steinernema carpocapsae]|uniref:Uncharacterized protein n=1 Tax=Steinernema carpocapsae TaxID=34508 RepID=A0A4U5NSM7_STECR|nr:hypothetical protein L596_011123 [Steinernema carpocapsae]
MNAEKQLIPSGFHAADSGKVNLVDKSSDALLVSQRSVHRVNEPQDLVELAKSVQTAREYVRTNATGKLSVIAEQMRYLQEANCELSQPLKHAFQRCPGSTTERKHVICLFHVWIRILLSSRCQNSEFIISALRHSHTSILALLKYLVSISSLLNPELFFTIKRC